MEQKVYANREWETALSTAQKLLENSDISAAHNLLKPFFAFSHYKNTADEIIQDYMHYKSFRSAYDNQDYKLMYSMANKYKHFKNSSIYIEVEKKWKKIISAAVNQISSMSNPNNNQFISILEPFLGVHEKTPIIQLLIKEPYDFVNFEQAIAKKDYESAFIFVEKYPSLKQSGEYISLIQSGETILSGCESAIKKCDIDTAKKFLSALKKFPGYQTKSQNIETKIEKVITMQHFIKEKKIKEFYDFCKINPFLEETEQYREILKHSNTKAAVG